jgi:SAM-dependent methyltransferase
MSERDRRLVFGEDATRYERARPSYPDELVDRLVAWVGPRARVVEIGSGTGKATRLLAARGMTGVGIEPHPAMAAIARDHLPAAGGWRIDVRGFEEWEPQPGDVPADLVTCAQAWHWFDPAVRMYRAQALLRPGGWLALMWNASGEDNDTPVDRAIAAAYRVHAPELDGLPTIQTAPPANWPGDTDGLDFGLPVERDYPWAQAYTTAEWLDLLRTHSNHSLLDPDRLDPLLAAIADAIDDHGGIYLHRYVTQLWATQRHP